MWPGCSGARQGHVLNQDTTTPHLLVRGCTPQVHSSANVQAVAFDGMLVEHSLLPDTPDSNWLILDVNMTAQVCRCRCRCRPTHKIARMQQCLVRCQNHHLPLVCDAGQSAPLLQDLAFGVPRDLSVTVRGSQSSLCPASGDFR